MNQIQTITAQQIWPNPANPRKKISEEELQELSQSIKSVGLLQPITVRPTDIAGSDDANFEIVCGHRRYEACKLAGIRDIPCIVCELSDEEAFKMMITENLQRKDVDPFDEADAFNIMMEHGYDVEALAEMFGKSKVYVYTRLKLQSLLPEFREKYNIGDLQFSHCLIIARLDAAFQKKLLKRYYSGTGWGDLTKRPISELKAAICNMSNGLNGVPFDTTACQTCEKNTGCQSLFLELASSCEDPDCFNRKYADYALEQFEIARKRNPDFYIQDDYGLSRVDGKDKLIVEELKKRGFIFKKEDDAYHHKTVTGSGRFDASDPSIVGFTFGYMGFFGPLAEKKSDKVAPHKDTWRLDRLANNRKERMEEIRTRMASDRIVELPDSALDVKPDDERIETVLKASLALLIPETDSDVLAFGISGSMDNAEDAIDKLSLNELVGVLSKFAAVSIESSDSDTRFMRRMFPEQFDNLEQEVVDAFYDEAREAWYGYDVVTNDMIDEDLQARVKSDE